MALFPMSTIIQLSGMLRMLTFFVLAVSSKESAAMTSFGRIIFSFVRFLASSKDSLSNLEAFMSMPLAFWKVFARANLYYGGFIFGKK